MLKKSVVGILSLLLLFTIAAALAWFVDFDATELGTATLREASKSTGIELEASGYRLNLWRGLELDNVEASARFPTGRYSIVIPAMRFAHSAVALFAGRLEIERVVLTGPRVAIVTGLESERASPSASPNRTRRRRERAESPTAESPSSPVELRIRELELSGAAFSFNDDVSLQGVDIVLRSPTLGAGALTLLHAVTATGDLSIRRLDFRTTTVRNIVATLEASGGRLDLVDGALETDRSSFQVNVHLDFNSFPVRHRLSLTGRLDTVPGELSFEGEGFGLDAANVKGEGRWLVPGGRFDDVPLWTALKLSGSATELPFGVDESRLRFDEDWIRGTVGLDGTLDLIVNGAKVGGTWDAPIRR
jgi:hypothetical protein